MKKLSKEAYKKNDGLEYNPYVAKNSGLKEITKPTIIIGIFLAFLFAASNAYAGMLSGLTVAAGIPGTILGSGLMVAFSKKANILNTNTIQGMSSGGESIASGIIFVLPAIFLLGGDINFFQGVLVGITGVILGISVTSIIYKYLIIDQHGYLPFPEAMAISESLVSSDAKGDGLKVMLAGSSVGGFVALVSNNFLNIFNNIFSVSGKGLYKWQFSIEANPLLLGIGFIVGSEVAIAMFAGSFLANFVMIPVIGYFASFANDTHVVWNNPDMHINQMLAADIQGSYTKYIGAGMMLAGGFIGAIKLIPVVRNSIKEMSQAKVENSKAQILLPIIGIVVLLVSSIFITSSFFMWIVAILFIVFFIFLFAIVSSRMTGDIGTSNLPVSGMTIASLLIITVIFLALGWTNMQSQISLLLILTAIVTGISTAGGYAQTQKATFIIGGSKTKIDKMFLIAAIVGVITTVGVIFLLRTQIESGAIQPPQANLMASLVQGILVGNLPWIIIFIGVAMALVLFFLELPIMTVAIGFYLPVATVTIILIGALLRILITKLQKTEEDKERKIEKGTIYSSGMIAGAAIVGLLGSVLSVIMISNTSLLAKLDVYLPTIEGNLIAMIILIAIFAISFIYLNKKDKKNV